MNYVSFFLSLVNMLLPLITPGVINKWNVIEMNHFSNVSIHLKYMLNNRFSHQVKEKWWKRTKHNNWLTNEKAKKKELANKEWSWWTIYTKRWASMSISNIICAIAMILGIEIRKVDAVATWQVFHLYLKFTMMPVYFFFVF